MTTALESPGSSVPEGGNNDGGAPEGGAPESHFADSFSESVRDNEVVRGFSSPEELATAFMDSHTKMDEMTAKIGELEKSVPVVPEKPEDYGIGVPEELKEFYSEETVEGFRQFSLENGLTVEQAKAVFELGKESVEAHQKARDAAIEELKASYGSDWDTSLERVKSMLLKFGGEELAADTSVANNPNVIKTLVELAKHLGEDNLEALGNNAGGEKSAAEQIFDNI